VIRPPDRQRIADLFEAALERPADRRAAFLDEACAGAPALRREVESLLSAYERSEGFLERPDAAQIAALVVAGETAPLPTQIGPYRIVRELGHGGQGRVLLGERADGQFEQRVAIKVVRGEWGGATAEAVARFLRERQILARLRHPAIATLFDGGVTPEGQPWFAMECVEGTSITAYATARGLGLAARLRLFAEVADAVAHAHRHQIVHRDLKPSNILVTGDGHVKLVDFGIAKPLVPGADEPVTRTAVRVLTPEYAAPEQVRGEPVTAASDIYALGAVLYELISGQRVHNLETYSPLEIAAVVCEQDPPPPSRVAPERIGGDLDAIVLKALRKEPERRYASVAAFREDLERHAAGLPVLARKGSVAYRVRKVVSRHRVRIAMLALLAGLGVTAGALVSRARAAAREAGRMREMEAYAQNLADGLAPGIDSGSTAAATRAALTRGRRFVFLSTRAGSGVNLYALDGDSAIELAVNLALPAWSPDGRRIVFERDGDICTIAADGSDLRQLTSGPALDYEPDWSPDGRQIVFRSNRGGGGGGGDYDIWVMNADGTGDAINLTRHPGWDGHPDWSPDGTRIVFGSERDGNQEIYVMNRDGSDPRNLTRHALMDIEPAWSPDGRHIAFVTIRDGNWEIYVMNADGSDPRNLTRHPAADGQPGWSPDGRMIAFSSDRRGNYDVFVMATDGTILANLTRHAADDAWPAWR
jgi:Tol biopolymer transport system component